MATDNTLSLRFNGNQLVRADGGIGEVEWISGSTDYLVSIEVNKNLYDPFTIVLSDKNNEKALEIYACKISGKKYTAKFKIPRILKTGDRVHIGIIAQIKEAKDVIVSNALPVLISSGIAQPNVSLKSSELNNSGFAALLNLFKGGMVIKKVSLIQETINTVPGKYLYITYDTTDKTEQKINLGKVTSSLVELGAQTSRENGDGGGAKLGYNSKLIGQQEGGAVGYATEAGRGFAGGSQAKTHEGVAIGFGAKAQPVATNSNNKTVNVDGIAIGKASTIDEKSPYATAIGGYTKITESPRSLAIGGGTDANAGATLDRSPYSIVIGYKATGERLSSGIVIGTSAGALGTNNTGSSITQNPIAIGNKSYAAWGGAIAIGQNSLSGVVRNKDGTVNPINGNGSDDLTNKGSSSISIGMNANARRSQSIAIGRGADTYRWGAIAIGYDAIAGNTSLDEKANFKDETETNKSTSGYSSVAIGAYAKAKGSGSVALGNGTQATQASSVAIGAGAKSTAASAIQLGNGTNDTKLSLKFRDKYLVRDGKLEVDLGGKDKISGILPISKGGTGAKTQLQALKSLGIYHGVRQIDFSSDNKNVTHNFSNFTAVFEESLTFADLLGISGLEFEKKPTILLTIEDETSVLYSFGLGVNKVTKTGFILRVQAGPNLLKSKAPYAEPYGTGIKNNQGVFSNKMKIHYLIIGENQLENK
jgi:hypothetical protein